MIYEVTSQEIATQTYPIQYGFSESSGVKGMDLCEIMDELLAVLEGQKLMKDPLFYQNLLSLFENDLSTVYTHFGVKTETSLKEKAVEATIPEEMMEYDVFVRMPPIKEYTIRVKIKSVEEAIPRIVEPEGV